MLSPDQTSIRDMLLDADSKLTDVLSGDAQATASVKTELLFQERNINLHNYTDILLERDRHFQEMLRDIDHYGKLSAERMEREERSSSPKESSNLDLRNAVVYALLKTILRECLSSGDIVDRKENIEMVYNWYRTKRKILMEEKAKERGLRKRTSQAQDRYVDADLDDTMMKEQRTTSGSHRKPSLSSTGVTRRRKSASKTPTRSPPAQWPRRDDRRTSIGVGREPRDTDRTASPHDWRHFTRRNLLQSHLAREAATERRPTTDEDLAFASLPSRPVSAGIPVGRDRKFGMLVGTADRPTTVGASLMKYEKDEGSKAADPGFLHMSTRRDIKSAGSMGIVEGIHLDGFGDEKADALHKLWLKHRAVQTQKELEEDEFKGVVKQWHQHRSRIEEEMNRRHESFRYGSRIVHRSPHASSTQSGRRMRAENSKSRGSLSSIGRDGKTADGEIGRERVAFDDDRSLMDDRESSFSEEGDDEEDEEENEGDDSEEIVTDHDERSLFDEIEAKMEQYPRRVLDPNRRIRSAQGKRPGLMVPTASLRRLGMTGLSPYVNEEALQRDFVPEHSGFTSMDSFVEGGGGAPSVGAPRWKGFVIPHQSTGRPKAVPPQNPPATLLDTVYVKGAPGKADKKKGKKKGGKKDAKKKDAGGKGKKDTKKKGGKGETEKKKPEPETVYYVQPPSQASLEQVRHCEKLKETFAENGVFVSTEAIERGLILPEDRSYEECLSLLPLPYASLFKNPTLGGGKEKKTRPKGKKAAKGGKGKAGGKKKKKK